MARQGYRGIRPTVLSLAVASCFVSSTALANPTGAQVINGQVSMLQNGNLLQVTNSPNSIINWQTFSIASGEITRFIQQSAASAVLNRVAAGNPSQILGMLQSNGRVFLVNPSGITFGAGSVVDVAGLVATSLNLSNADFLAGKLKFTDGASAGSVVNQGNITASGGEVYLVGNAVTNNGIIKSPNGEVVLAAGSSVELVNPGTPNLRVEVAAPDNQAVNLGQIVVDSGRAGIYAGLITNSGTVRADSVVSEGGRILLKATKGVMLSDTSVLSAQGKGGGEIKVLGGDTVQVAGKLDASAPNGGDGGFIETSAHNVKIADGTRVTASAPFGKTGTWLIDPVDFTIASSGGDVTGAQISCQLGDGTTGCAEGPGGINVTITTDPSTSGNGDIFVDDSITWNSSNSLTLNAHRNVQFSSVTLSNTGAGSVTANAGLGGTGDVVLSGTTINVGGDVNLNAPRDVKVSYASVDAGGNIGFQAGQDIIVQSSRTWAGAGGPSGDRSLTYTAGRDISISSPDGQSTIDASTNFGNATVTLTTTTGNVAVDGSRVYASVDGAEGGKAKVVINAGQDAIISNSEIASNVQYSGDSLITVDAARDISFTGTDINSHKIKAYTSSGNASVTLTAGRNIGADGGEGALVYSGNGGTATASLNAGGALTVNNTVIEAYGSGAALVELKAAGAVNVTGSEVEASVGFASSSSTSKVVISSAGGNIALNSDISAENDDGGESTVNISTSGSGSVTISGGQVTASDNSGLVAAQLSVAAGTGGIQVTGGNVSAQNSGVEGGGATLDFSTTGSISIGSTVYTSGGDFGGIALTAGDKITGTGSGRLSANYTLSMTAVNGIGTIGNPINIAGVNLSAITAHNTGSAGDIALRFPDCCNLNIGSSSLLGIVNSNAAGTYFIQADGGEGMGVTGALMPGGANPGSGQGIYLSANSAITFYAGEGGGAGGSVAGAGKVTLEAPAINLQPGTSISAGNVLLKADDMDIQGSVSAGNNIYVTTQTGAAIQLGTVGSGSGFLALDAAELARFSALGLGIGTDGTNPNANGLTVTAPIGPFNAFPNLFGTFISQGSSGTAINSPGGLNAFASSSSISLTDVGNNIGTFGGKSNGVISLVTTGNLGLGTVEVPSSDALVSFTAGGTIFGLPGGVIKSPSVHLTAANGVGQAAAPIFLATASNAPASVMATNTGSGDIVLSQPGANVTVGTAGWQLSNAGGDYIIGGNNVTLNSGAPSNGDMFVAANGDIVVGPTGYSNSGAVILTALNNVNVNGNLTASDVALFGANQVNINGATATGTDSVSVLAGVLNVTAGSAKGGLKAGSVLGAVAGEINITGGSGPGASAEVSVGPAGTMEVFTVASANTTGNINIKGGSGSGAFARLFGDPDIGSLAVPLSVGGAIHMDQGTGTGAFARVESAAVNSIHVNFANATGGGFFVNGSAGAVSAGDSGFFAGGLPAVPGQNFFVTYGTTHIEPSILPPAVTTAVDQVIAMTNQQTNVINNNATTANEDNGGGGVVGGDPKDEKQKKALPICGK